MDTGWLSQAAADFLVRHGSGPWPVLANVVEVPSAPPLPGMGGFESGLGPGIWVVLCSWSRAYERVRCPQGGMHLPHRDDEGLLLVRGLVGVLPRQDREQLLRLHRLVPLPMLWCFDLIAAGQVEAARFLVDGLGVGGTAA